MITFRGGFENGILYQDSGLANTWMHHQHRAGAEPYALQLVTDIVRRGTSALRVEVRSGDVVAGGERAEVTYMAKADGTNQIENEMSGTKYFAVSCYLPLDWVAPVANYGLFFQLHMPDTYPNGTASVAMMTGNRYFARIVGGDADTGLTIITCEFSNNALNLGHWVDFIFKVGFAIDITGTFQIWRRDEGEINFTSVYQNDAIATLAYRSAHPGEPSNHYWKSGFYRGPTAHANILYLDCHTRGDTFDEVRRSAFGGSVSMPMRLHFMGWEKRANS